MNEFTQGISGTLGIFSALLYSLFCWFGGRDKNYLGIRSRTWGRYIAPLTLCTLTLGLSLLSHRFSPWMLAIYLTYFISHHMGYGGDNLWIKIKRRTIWSLMRTAASLPIVLVTGSWTMFIAQITVGLLITLILGVLNPLEAPVEEGTINFSNVFLVPLMVL